MFECERYRVDTLAAEYLEFEISALASEPCGAIEVRARVCGEVGWMLLGIGAGRELRWISRTRGNTFARSISQVPGEPLERLVLIVVGLDEATPFEVRIDHTAPKLSIVAPTESVPAHVGLPALPDRFFARVRVEGLDPIEESDLCGSVPALEREAAALRAEDFLLVVVDPSSGARAQATVVAAEHIGGGEYLLSVMAPFAPSIGTYDLEASLIDECDVARSPRSIIYGNTIVNHVLVIDRSASMSVPEGSSKLDAAKVAAELYVDAVSSKDRVGIVVFDGRDECVDNSQTVLPLEGADEDHRDAARGAIASIEPAHLTSIGDGLWRAQDLLSVFDSPTEVRTLLVLSDGMETDERYVLDENLPCDDGSTLAPALPRVAASDTIANSLALGPESDQGLMQTIAEEARGLYAYVDVTASDGGGNSLTAALPLALRLSDAFLRSLAHARTLERIDDATGRALGRRRETVELEVQNGDPAPREGVFFLAWDEPKVEMEATLFAPDGQSAEGRAQRFAGGNHVVWHLRAEEILDPGTWTIEVTSSDDTVYFAGVLGRGATGLSVRFSTSQERTGGLEGGLVESTSYEQGVPVVLRATVTDREGPVTGAEVLVQVERPDGRVLPDCDLRLYDDGRHHDGEPNDGVYGVLYTHTQLASERGVPNDDPRDPGRGPRGSYIVSGIARGKTASGPFERPIEGHFHVFVGGKDFDGDGLPTTWELWYGTDPNVRDDERDSDND
ncbi:MAG TPA: VWA domain-containing protein, partial [Planctomycetota bacterium]|nr:VWA domain-containing protein [Planctomycetota bacterium]